MKFIQFYHYNLAGIVDEVTGDRSVIVVDGRLSNANVRIIAETECRKRRYVAWAIFAGETFTRSNRISQVNCLPPENSAHGM